MKLVRENQYIRSLELMEEKITDHDLFPFHLPFIKDIKKLIFYPNVTFIIGENGMGKSTLLEGIAIAYGFNPEGGTLNFNFTNYDSHARLDEYIRLIKSGNRPADHFFFRAETFYRFSDRRLPPQ